MNFIEQADLFKKEITNFFLPEYEEAVGSIYANDQTGKFCGVCHLIKDKRHNFAYYDSREQALSFIAMGVKHQRRQHTQTFVLQPQLLLF